MDIDRLSEIARGWIEKIRAESGEEAAQEVEATMYNVVSFLRDIQGVDNKEAYEMAGLHKDHVEGFSDVIYMLYSVPSDQLDDVERVGITRWLIACLLVLSHKCGADAVRFQSMSGPGSLNRFNN